MQPPTDGPRSAFTTTQVQYLIQNASSFDVDMGLELMDGLDTMQVQSDLSENLTGATVSRNNFANIHASATFALSAPLSWGNSIVRPYMTVTGPASALDTTLTSMRFYLGAYFVDSPQEDLSQIPPTYDATGYDVLSILDDAIGDDYAIASGELYLARVEAILLGRGITQYHIDQDQGSAVLPSPKVYTLDQNPTWLQVVNDLLAAIGYQGIWTDWNGTFQVRDYDAPATRSPEWALTADVSNTLLTQRRQRTKDFYDAPNRWVFYQSNVTETQPIDGNGRYEYTNQTTGETSVESRGGRTITRPPEGVDVADHASLVAYAQGVIDADMLIPTKISIDTAPLPLIWHMDRYVITDPVLGAALQVLGMSWSMDLSGSDIRHEWSTVA
jgi:hypothetical protein